MLDSLVSEQNHHLGFLVHDCPREADMSIYLYKHFFYLIAEIAQQTAVHDTTPFQCIITTTTPPPERMQTDEYVVLKLRANQENELLFRQQMARSLPMQGT